MEEGAEVTAVLSQSRVGVVRSCYIDLFQPSEVECCASKEHDEFCREDRGDLMNWKKKTSPVCSPIASPKNHKDVVDIFRFCFIILTI